VGSGKKIKIVSGGEGRGSIGDLRRRPVKRREEGGESGYPACVVACKGEGPGGKRQKTNGPDEVVFERRVHQTTRRNWMMTKKGEGRGGGNTRGGGKEGEKEERRKNTQTTPKSSSRKREMVGGGRNKKVSESPEKKGEIGVVLKAKVSRRGRNEGKEGGGTGVSHCNQ